MTKKAAAQQAGITVAALLKVDLTGVLVRGWREHRDIVSAARRTLAAPGSTELVSMATHEVTLEQRPSVSVLVDGQQVATLRLGLSIVFDVNALLLGISSSRLVAVHTGNCDITATLAIQGADVLIRNAHLDLPGVISLRRGIRLLPIGQYPPGDYPGSGHQAGIRQSRSCGLKQLERALRVAGVVTVGGGDVGVAVQAQQADGQAAQ